MTSLCAIVPVANLEAANAALEAAGHGPRCFSVPAWADGTLPAFAALHAWHDPVLVANIKALDGVEWEESAGDPVTRTRALIEAQGATWGADAPELPETGTVQPGLYRYGESEMRRIIQAHDRTVYGGDPAQYASLCRVARDPRRALPWRQPIDEFDAYQLDTGFGPERVTHAGKTWETTVANNVWEPGTAGTWQELN
jgi:hypothetical protein